MRAIPNATYGENGVFSLGLTKVRPASAVLSEQEERRKSFATAEETPVVSELVGYIQGCWHDAKEAKRPIEDQMLKNLRQRHGVYEPDKLAAIEQMGGSQVYVMLTATKCRAAEAWINDILQPVADRPWALHPTPMAELTPDLEAQIRQEVMEVFDEVLRQAQMVGQVINLTDLKDELREYATKREKDSLKEIQQEAEGRAELMSLKIEDQLEEGGWKDVFWQVINDLVTLKAGILKGPVIRRRKSEKWVKGPYGWTVDTPEQLVIEFERVSPLDLYPAPDSRHPDDGYLIERIPLTRKELIAMIGVPGYSEENIRAALRDYGRSGRKEEQLIDAERAELEFGSTESLYSSDKIEGLEFWGSVQGSYLKEWGMNNVDEDLEYEINALIVGSYAIRVILNPDKLGRKPYSVDAFERVPGSFWGKGVPELMSDIQDVCNAVARSIVNNSGLASGPQVEVNVDRMQGDSDDIWPWKIWPTTNQQMAESPAIRFTQPTIITGPLLQVFEFFSALSEDQTGIPRWAYGNTQLGGAGGTASGLTMLMTHASRGIKEVISHIDRMVSGVISRVYAHNMLYLDNDSLKGDCKVMARGSSSLLAKEQKLARRNEYLVATANPVDMQLIGLKNRAKLLIQQARDLEMEIEENDELKEQIAQVAQQFAAQNAPQPGPSPIGGSQPGSGRTPDARPRGKDAAGNPAGGTDDNLFQNPSGVTPGVRAIA